MAGLYDLMLMIDPNAPDERRDGVIAEVESLIEAGDGQIVGNHDWGQRRMTFEIDHREEAEYRLYQFEGGRELLERLQSRLRITDGLLRFRIIKTKAGLPVPPPPDQQGARRRDERDETDTRVAARAAADAPPQ
jgi:small subunit ribosomal protein S6